MRDSFYFIEIPYPPTLLSIIINRITLPRQYKELFGCEDECKFLKYELQEK